MINLDNIDEVRALKGNLHVVFDSPQGKEALKFMQQLGGWFPTIFDSFETNEIIARDANHRLIGTLRTILELSPEQIVALANEEK